MSSDFNTIPIIRLELQRASHAFMAAISPEFIKLEKDVRAAIEEACTPENIRRVLREAVQTTLREAINREVENYYKYSGDGQKQLKKAVADLLSRQVFEP
jgi:Tfp pilus assembly ATPase PilU